MKAFPAIAPRTLRLALPLAAVLSMMSSADAQYGHDWLFPTPSAQQATGGFEPFGAEDVGAEDDSPRIAEPMVFDLVRPLGATQGEFEINTLAVFPLDGHPTEWAPEAELAILDGVAVELELPFADSTLASYKGAAQVTFGRAFEDRFIHGGQFILQHFRDPRVWDMTFLYLAGVRFDDYWSLFAMAGLRNVSGGEVSERTERLFNLSLFLDVSESVTLGVENNVAQSLSGASAWRIMPQCHWEITDYWMLQAGTGVHFGPERTTPEAALRLIRSF